MKKENVIKEVEKLYFKEEGLIRMLRGEEQRHEETKNKNIELQKEVNSLKKELREAKLQIKALQTLQKANNTNIKIDTSKNMDVQEFIKNSLQFLSKTMELSQVNIAGGLNK